MQEIYEFYKIFVMHMRSGMNLGDKIVVANTGDNSLSIIDCHAGMESDRIYMPPDSGPYALVKAKDKSHILVSQYYGDSLLYIDLQHKDIKKSLFLGRRPGYMAIDPLNNILYITNADSDSISIVAVDDEIRLIGQLPVGSMPQGIDCHFNDEVLAVANTNSNSIYIINTFNYEICKVIKFESYPFQVKYSADGRRIFVGCSCLEKQEEGSIIVLNTDDYSIESEIFLNGMPGQIYETSDGKYVLAASMGKGGLQIIDLKKEKVIKNIVTNGMTHCIAVDRDEKYVYVTNTDDNSVSVVDWRNGRRLTNIQVGKEPNGILFIPGDP